MSALTISKCHMFDDIKIITDQNFQVKVMRDAVWSSWDILLSTNVLHPFRVPPGLLVAVFIEILLLFVFPLSKLNIVYDLADRLNYPVMKQRSTASSVLVLA